MTILSREGINRVASRTRAQITYADIDSLIDTARAYHDQRDAVLALLDERMKTILHLRARGCTLEVIGEHVGISKERVRQLLKNVYRMATHEAAA